MPRGAHGQYSEESGVARDRPATLASELHTPAPVSHTVEFEEHLRIDGWSPAFLLGTAHQVADEAEVQLGLKVPVEVAGRHEILDGAITERGGSPRLGPHHGLPPSQTCL